MRSLQQCFALSHPARKDDDELKSSSQELEDSVKSGLTSLSTIEPQVRIRAASDTRVWLETGTT